jgi:hypothetical protein
MMCRDVSDLERRKRKERERERGNDGRKERRKGTAVMSARFLES